MTMSPTLSVIIPTLNAEGEIDQLLFSIEQQTQMPMGFPLPHVGFHARRVMLRIILYRS